MSEPVFKRISFALSGLMDSIAMGQIGLPDLQRPFVWPNKKVRDLFDSMYRGYPVGYLLLWENAAYNGRSIGTNSKELPPQLLVIDGQQRLTSLFAVLRGVKVKRQNFSEERIRIAFRPLDGSFEVPDITIRRDPTWISDISKVWSDDTDLFDLVDEYLTKLSASRDLSIEAKKAAKKAISKLANLPTFPLTALQLAAGLDEEQVADVFVRINSKGTPLNQADFILTLMSVFQDDLRKELEAFCQSARIPSSGEPSPFNYFITPDPDHLLRVCVALGFRRATLRYVYSILRGKDLETGELSEERRAAQFEILREAQVFALGLGNWQGFLKCLMQAGFRSGKMVSSRNAILYAYAFFLIAKRDFGLKGRTLRDLMARWFFFVSLTGRYTDSPESRMEQDLADLREVHTAQEFIDHLERTIHSVFTDDYWSITLPEQLATSASRSPALFAYYASLNLLDARVLFSKLKLSALLDPSVRGPRAAVERHHLFPKAYLWTKGIRSRREVNQIANYALVEWEDNADISDRPPDEYFPKFVEKTITSAGDLDQMRFWHALPEGWESMPFAEFLVARRREIAGVIRAGVESLNGHPGGLEPDLAIAGQQGLKDRVLLALAEPIRKIVEELLEEPTRKVPELKAEVYGYLRKLEILKVTTENDLDLDTARQIVERCDRLLDDVREDDPPDRRDLIQAAVLYFILEDDEQDDHAEGGLDDDELVLSAVESVLGIRSTAA